MTPVCSTFIFFHIKNSFVQALVAHACNPSYFGDRDQEDRGSRPAWANSLRDPISKLKKKKKTSFFFDYINMSYK
jgi:hypothetical protein